VIERQQAVAQRIRRELIDLERIVARIKRAWAARGEETDTQDLFLDAVALNLHDFYTGLERSFHSIATLIDNNMPSGRDWHKDLLNQMSTERSGIRHAVLTSDTANILKEYLGFRHVVRNVYTFSFNPTLIKPLVDRLPDLFAQVRQELDNFSTSLEQASDKG
jgi:hypothetical protein